MMIFLIHFLIVLAASDTSPCPGASHVQTPHFDICWCVASDEKSIVFTVNASMFNYFAIDYKPNMIDVRRGEYRPTTRSFKSKMELFS